MNTRYKFLFIAFLSLAIGISACKEEKKTLKNPKTTKKIVKAKPIKKKVEKVVPKVVVKKAINKYFLIKASFKNQSNAKRMKSKLQEEGFDSEIMLSNNNFYRVSYQGFSKRDVAFNELKQARANQGTEDVWLHIKH
ncbi:SPOR domain-containing protein [Ancylomarina sp. 16SWW S1-10-2]|uniref:SPOR domain-containing protein n=1 Tax=Ancylomarina sp. 16SWW S1-10-2 TaxID=2499681 RepID=UPI0012AD72ED|nr:SPOR domain-containing protein [Ancylomarina sp. 16SWW S1-10-2]MRT93885.1 SPOR domain-containing protein [Ancylomarina sp. 16SWW S1-10-2]